MRDAELVRRYVEQGSEAAFATLVERHGRLVYATCRRELGDPGLAEDAAQAVFLLLARKARALRGRAELAGWLFTAARLVARNLHKQERRRQVRERRVVAELADRQCREAPPEEADGARLNDALAALRPGDRDALLLRYGDGLSLAELGDALGITAEAAQMRVARALGRLRRRLDAGGAALTAAGLTALLTDESGRTPAEAVSLAARVMTALRAGASAVRPVPYPSPLSVTTRGGVLIMAATKTKIAAVALVLGAALVGVTVTRLARTRSQVPIVGRWEKDALSPAGPWKMRYEYRPDGTTTETYNAAGTDFGIARYSLRDGVLTIVPVAESSDGRVTPLSPAEVVRNTKTARVTVTGRTMTLDFGGRKDVLTRG